MNISKVDLKLTGSDVISIINDFVKVKGLVIESVNIGDFIKLKGTYKFIVEIPFVVDVSVKYVHDNNVVLSLEKIKISKLGIIKFIKNQALKIAMKSLGEYGLSSSRGEINIDLNKIFSRLPFIDLKADSIVLADGYIYIEAESINIDISRFGEEGEKETTDEENNEDEEEEDLSDLHKTNDFYSEGRNIVRQKFPDKVSGASDYILIIPDIICLLYRLLRDNRVSKKTKTIIVSTVTYLSLPTDLIPDSVPLIGSIDDIGVIFFALNKIITDIPLKVIVENWEGDSEIIIVLKKAADYLVNYTSAKNVEKIYSVIDKLSTQ